MKINRIVYLLITTLLVTSCGSKSESAADYAPEYAVAEESYGSQSTASSDGDRGLVNTATELKREQMFAKVGTIENVTEDSNKNSEENTVKNFDETIVDVENLVSKYDGYFENSNFTNYGRKYFASTIKVPVKDFQNLFNDLKSAGINVYNESSTVNETAGYYSMKSQLEVQKISKARHEELIKTTTSTKDLLKLYDSYYELITNIEIAEAKLKEIESSTSYSTIHFNLSDGSKVAKVDEDSFASKVKEGFGASIKYIENLIIGLAYISVPLIIILIFFFIGYKKAKKLFKKKNWLEKRIKKENIKPNLKKEFDVNQKIAFEETKVQELEENKIQYLDNNEK